MSQTTTVSVIGATGYSGMELVWLLSRHRNVEVGPLFANSSAGKRIGDAIPRVSGRVDGEVRRFEMAALDGVDIVFLALPSGEAMHLVPGLLAAGKRVIDLGGDFRLAGADLYREFYGREHVVPELLPAPYGLPELGRSGLAAARLVANPGCYATSAILPLAPLLAGAVIRPDDIVISSMSGVSGAGRTASAEFSFSEVNESVRAYRVASHQHLPEMRAALAGACGTTVDLTFTPHLVPITRGIHTTIHARLAQGAVAAEVAAALTAAYADEPFIRLLGDVPPEVRHAAHTNRADIGWHVDARTGRVTLLSVIDNLLKGAAGQAMQNMNILCGYDEWEGLP